MSFDPNEILSSIPQEKRQELLGITNKRLKEFRAMEFTAEAGGGMIKITTDYTGMLKNVEIDMDLVSDNKQLISDLICAAHRLCVEKIVIAEENIMFDSGDEAVRILQGK